MALKPKIYKLKLTLSDLNRNYYDTLNLTLAQHPSETAERMMVRVVAFALNAQEFLSFTKGLSAIEEPDLWARTLDDQISLWIDIGEPAVDRVKKSTRLAHAVKVYSFNTKSDVWWSQNQAAFSKLDASLYRFEWSQIKSLAKLIQRSMDWSVTITGDSAYFATERGAAEITLQTLQQGE
ncbi:MAG: YaeQ family protein [Pseudomonadota bacterium]